MAHSILRPLSYGRVGTAMGGYLDEVGGPLNIDEAWDLTYWLFWQEDFKRILTEPEASLIKLYIALMETEKVTLNFTDDAIDEIATIPADVNATVENIGARRLHTILEKVLEGISFTATDTPNTEVEVNAEFVRNNLGQLTTDSDLSKFIL